MVELSKRSRGKCQMTGIPFTVSDNLNPHERQPWTPSLDRIDRTKGYVPGNCRLICSIANIAMNTWGEEPLMVLADVLVRQREGNCPKRVA